MRRRMAGSVLVLVIAMLAACGRADQPYARLHDAAPSADGDAVLLLVESGVSRVEGSVFSGNYVYSAPRLALWRFDRPEARLAELRELPLPVGFKPFNGEPRLADFAAYGAPVQPSLPNCRAVLSACAIERTPQAYLAEDLAGGQLRGLQLVDPVGGRLVRVEGAALTAVDWPHRTRAAARAARDAALQRSVAALFAAARARLVQMEAAADRGAADRGATFVDAAAGATLEGLMPEYRIDSTGVISARLQYGGDAPLSLRWKPLSGAPGATSRVAAPYDGFTCESNRPDIARWAPGCRFMPTAATLNPEIAYLESQLPRLQAEARKDPAYESAQRGTTFGLRFADAAADYSSVGCLGVPGSRVGGCDAERGDSVCSLRLPVLCVNPEARGEDGEVAVADPGWLPGRLATSQPVRGDELATAAAASARCAAELGAGWRIASWRDRGDGFVARGVMRGDSRAWIDVPDQPRANCWGRSG